MFDFYFSCKMSLNSIQEKIDASPHLSLIDNIRILYNILLKKKCRREKESKRESPCEYSKKGQHATWNIYYLDGVSLGL